MTFFRDVKLEIQQQRVPLQFKRAHLKKRPSRMVGTFKIGMSYLSL